MHKVKNLLPLMGSTLGKKISRRPFKTFFSFFPRNQVLTLHANCLHWRPFLYMKCQTLFSGKSGFDIARKLSPLEKMSNPFFWEKYETVFSLLSAELAHSVVKVKEVYSKRKEFALKRNLALGANSCLSEYPPFQKRDKLILTELPSLKKYQYTLKRTSLLLPLFGKSFIVRRSTQKN